MGDAGTGTAAGVPARGASLPRGADGELPLWQRVLPGLYAFAAIRLLGLAALAVWSHARGTSARVLLSARWDSLWYVRVVKEGYGFVLVAPDGRHLSDLAFFPLFPWLERAVAAATGLGAAGAGLLVSAVASLAAAAGVHAVAEQVAGRRAALFTVALWAALPVGVVESMAYSESLFTALAAWALYAVARRWWLAAGLLASLAGLTRATGAAVVLAVWAGCALSLRASRAAPWRPAAGAVLAPAGLAGYVLWAGHRAGGGLFGYLDVQRSWGNGFDGGLAFCRFLGGMAGRPPYVGGPALAAGVLVLVALYVRGFGPRAEDPGGVPAARVRPPAGGGGPDAARVPSAVREAGVRIPLQVYTGVVMVLALGTSGYFGSKPRLLLPAFGLLVPVAARLAAARPARAAAVLAGLAALSACYGAFWLNGSGPP